MRNDINNTPHLPLWLGLMVVLVFTFFVQCKGIDIQLHDSYFVFDPMSFASLFIIPQFLFGFIYLFVVRTGRKLTKWMTMFHIAFSLFFIMTLIFWGCEVKVLSLGSDLRFQLAVLLFLLAQIVFVINISKAFLLKK